MMPIKFTINHDINNFPIATLEDSIPVEQCNLKWSIDIRRGFDVCFVDIKCINESGTKAPWWVETFLDLQVSSGNDSLKVQPEDLQNVKFNGTTPAFSMKFLTPEEIHTNLKTVTIACNVTVIQIDGVSQKKPINFQNPTDLSDFVLIVGNQKFHVVKDCLVVIPYFKKLFSQKGNSKKTEFTMDEDVDAESLQNILEFLQINLELTAGNIAGVLKLAKKFEYSVINYHCEEFLKKDEDMSKRQKLSLADKYGLKSLMDQVISGINSPADLGSLLPNDIYGMGQQTLAAVLQQLIPK